MEEKGKEMLQGEPGQRGEREGKVEINEEQPNERSRGY